MNENGQPRKPYRKICPGCGAEIIMAPTAKGHWMPLNPEAIKNVVHVKEGVALVIATGFTSHWSTCPKAEAFRTQQPKPRAPGGGN